jgi:DNA mismatch repair protein MutS
MAATPMMRQYEEAKRACPEALLLFRMGDFYEMFHDDAKTAARVLNLALTSREKGAGAVPMAGFPHHQLESYLGKLIAAGFRAAVCEQVEDPKLAKGLVRREVTRVVTPGTVTDDALLDPRESSFLAAVSPGDPAGLAWVELSTGRFVAAGFSPRQLPDQLARIAPAECLTSDDGPPLPAHGNGRMMLTRRPAWAFSEQNARQVLAKHFGTAGLEGFGFSDDAADAQAIRAAGAILDYLAETQKSSLAHVDRLTPYRTAGTLEIDQSSRRSLEITRTIRDARREGSLLWVLDRTVTAMGSRLLAEWVANPLCDVAAIRARLGAVAELVGDPQLSADLHESLRRVYDVERLLARVATGRASPRDLSFLGRTLRSLPAIKARLAGHCGTSAEKGTGTSPEADVAGSDLHGSEPVPFSAQVPLLAELEAAIDACPELCATLAAALNDECPLVAGEGGFIRDGFSGELDALRELAHGGKQWIARYQAQETERIGIPSLKVGFNKVFGYYIEITNAHREKIPADYIRKQTIKNAERYITPELKEYEEKVLTADEKAKQLEYTLFLDLRSTVAADRRRMQSTAAALAQLDVLAGLAELARARNYCRPEVVEGPVLRIIDGRHPVLDVVEPEGKFVPNDAIANCRLPNANGKEDATAAESRSILLITGPNMAGKSTYIRQVALMTLMAQIGSFVPAREATIGLADRIFARVGASDELTRGQSTFMVEMTETARILHTATPRSLVILDEIGRGTSTYDGISLAWSVVEYLHEHTGCRTLFATHYHELTDLEKSLAGVKNLNVAVREWQDEVIFLHKIVEGAADKSYGIHVARLAGVPREVIERSKDILAQLEEEHLDAEGRAKIARPAMRPKATRLQLTLFGAAEHPLLDELRRLDLDNLTPLRAFQLLGEWREKLAREEKPKVGGDT